ncbi:MAG: hypothetical protein JWP37_1999, partial [Mucilaginibacter sp.]|nr:hypothetical protein [Mucilaginibacter sp.]
CKFARDHTYHAVNIRGNVFLIQQVLFRFRLQHECYAHSHHKVSCIIAASKSKEKYYFGKLS